MKGKRMKNEETMEERWKEQWKQWNNGNKWRNYGNSERFYFILFGSKITEDCDCSHEIKRCLLLGRKAMTNLDSILKSRDRGCPVKAVVFPVVTYGCESWTLKTAEHRRIDAFELWCWRRLLRVPWTVWRSNQSILKEISPEYSLEGLMMKLQYFGHLMWRTDSLLGSELFLTNVHLTVTALHITAYLQLPHISIHMISPCNFSKHRK